MAVENVTGGRTVWRSDIKPAACKLIAHRWPNDPNLGDITKVDWSQVEPVDIITGGFPCTDISAAGKQLGLIRHGEHKTRSGLWSEMCEAIDQLRPSLVVAENVRALTSVKADSNLEPCPWCVGTGDDFRPLRALGAVLGDLADIGYDAAWHGLRVADIGAPHGRFRVFLIAWPAGNSAHIISQRPGEDVRAENPQGATRGADSTPGHSNGMAGTTGRTLEGRPEPVGEPGTVERIERPDRIPVTDAALDGRDEGWPEPAWLIGGSDDEFGGASAAADADLDGLEIFRWQQPVERDADGRSGADTTWGAYEPAIRKWGSLLGRPAPAPTDKDGRLSPLLCEWMMGLPLGHITDVPGLSRSEMLSLAGDGVVPAQAEAALRLLLPYALERAA